MQIMSVSMNAFNEANKLKKRLNALRAAHPDRWSQYTKDEIHPAAEVGKLLSDLNIVYKIDGSTFSKRKTDYMEINATFYKKLLQAFEEKKTQPIAKLYTAHNQANLLRNAQTLYLKIAHLPPPPRTSVEGINIARRSATVTPLPEEDDGKISTGSYAANIDLETRLRSREINVFKKLGNTRAPVPPLLGAWMFYPWGFLTLFPLYRNVISLEKLLYTRTLTPKHVNLYRDAVRSLWEHGVHIAHTLPGDILFDNNMAMFTDLKHAVPFNSNLLRTYSGSIESFWDTFLGTTYQKQTRKFMDEELKYPPNETRTSDIEYLKMLEAIEKNPTLSTFNRVRQHILKQRPQRIPGKRTKAPEVRIRNVRGTNENHQWQLRLFGKVWSSNDIPEEKANALRARENANARRAREIENARRAREIENARRAREIENARRARGNANALQAGGSALSRNFGRSMESIRTFIRTPNNNDKNNNGKSKNNPLTKPSRGISSTSSDPKNNDPEDPLGTGPGTFPPGPSDLPKRAGPLSNLYKKEFETTTQ
jgi:hypothetical protein